MSAVNGDIKRIICIIRVDPYIWTELAPVLEGSGSRRRHPRKGILPSTLFVSYSLHVLIIRFFTLRQKRIRGGSTFAGRNSGPLKRHLLLARTPQCHAWLGAAHFSAVCQTHIRCSLNWTAGDRQAGREAGKGRGRMEYGREGARGGWGGMEQGEGVRKR